MARPSKTIDEYSFAARPLLFSYGTQQCGIATGFFWKHGAQVFLVTNWHNVTGLDPSSGQPIHSQGCRPTNFEVSFFSVAGDNTFAIRSFDLYSNGKPRWLVHHEHGKLADVVAMPVKVPDGHTAHPINTLSHQDMKIRVGHDLFILGFPFATTIFDRGGVPTWKRASLASEPEWQMASEVYSLVDTASRSGMSGAPVIRRTFSSTELKDGTYRIGGASKFFGIYAGRIVSSNKEDLQLGRVYERDIVEEVVTFGVPDTSAEEPPGAEKKTKLISSQHLSSANTMEL